MLKLEDIKKNAAISGIDPDQLVRVVTTEPAGADALTVYYKTPDGQLLERMLFREDEPNLAIATVGLPWAFDASGDDFKLVVEAYRINLAHLFDPMMAVYASNVDPLPHQITAVYEAMLPRQPLRYVLADDPGAGKTIMAGLLIQELLMRADARRVLIVAPGSLVEQWQDELFEKFGLTFELFSRELADREVQANPFERHDLLIARIDQLARSDDYAELLRQTRWDLIVVDEAHKLSASYYGDKINKTRRFELGELLGAITRHFLLMTATPHNGKEADFQLFLSLLDADRFYGKFRDGVHKVDVSDVMRRMVKEDLLKFDGTPLFPERRARTVNYQLSEAEAALYEAVTTYVKEEMNRADQLKDGKRRGTVGFALTLLQRRLASSPEAIYQSLRRRRVKLQSHVQSIKLDQRGQQLAALAAASTSSHGDALWRMDDDLPAADYEQLEEDVLDQATAAQTIQELEAELLCLGQLEAQARQVVHGGQDRKWDELSSLLQDTPELRDALGHQRKLIIFTEHRDTLNYLAIKLRGLLGSEDAVVMIHGGVRRDDRRKVQERFRHDPTARVLLATDAAGEGVNLQNANLMINYDLPWNPNRLEQRFGRIHRIGQTEVCHLWNLVAAQTREGDVFTRLFEKLEIERAALGGRVFDILGEVFEEHSLKDLLIDAIRYGEDPQVRERLLRQVEGALDAEHIRAILARNALSEEIMDHERLFEVRAQMERAQARRLQPFFIRSFFVPAFEQLGGKLRPREQGRAEITHVPAMILERDRQLVGRDQRHRTPALKRYERVCFEKQQTRLPERPDAALASLIHPGHPLMRAVIDLTLERHRDKLKRGALLLDRADPGLTPRVLMMLDHAVKEGADPSRHASRRLQFVALDPEGQAHHAGLAPHLDLEPLDLTVLDADTRARLDALRRSDWLTQDLEQLAITYASAHLVPEHFQEVRDRRHRQVDKILAAVHERLVREINFWSDRHVKLRDDLAAGKDLRLTLDNVTRMIEELDARLAQRTAELKARRHVISASPVVVGGALVIPQGWLEQRADAVVSWSADAQARAHIEQAAMRAVIDAERALGHQVIDVSAQKCGWDVTSIPRAADGSLATSRHIEVKGRVRGATTVTVTRNEILYALNQAEKFILAIVLVADDGVEGPFYVREPFTHEPDFGVASVNYNLQDLLKRARAPEAT